MTVKREPIFGPIAATLLRVSLATIDDRPIGFLRHAPFECDMRPPWSLISPSTASELCGSPGSLLRDSLVTLAPTTTAG